MTMRGQGDQFLRELKAALFSRIARRAMSKKRTGLDGLAKSLVERQGKDATSPDPELEHPETWDRPID